MLKSRLPRLFLTFGLAVTAFAGSATSVTLAAGSNSRSSPRSQTPAALSANATVFAMGLINPRGLKFGPDGNLYVAEGGTGGTQMTVGQCQQVPGVYEQSGIGPYSGGFTSRISKINPAGVRSTVVDGLPSSQTNPATGGLTSGVADIVFIDGKLYGMEAGAGCSHGLAGTDNTLFRVNSDGTTTTVADLSAFVKANPVAHPDPDDFEPDGTWYGMVAVHDTIYATEPNHQELDRITLDGHISRVVDASLQFMPPANWQGLTGIAYHGGFYVGSLGTFPVQPGSQSLHRITRNGHIQTVASGLTAVLGVAFDKDGRLYALETDTAAGFPGLKSAGTGQVMRVNRDGSLTTIASGLVFPTAMTFGPDGELYVSNFGFGVPPVGLGQIVRITVPDSSR
jgi:hypothetical protein